MRSEITQGRWKQWLAGNLSAAAATLAGASLGVALFAPDGGGPPLLFPAAGVALAVVMLLGFGVAPGVAAGACLSAWWSGESSSAALAGAAGTALSSLGAAVLLRRASLPDDAPHRVRWVYTLLLAAAACAPIHATTRAAADLATGAVLWGQFGALWWRVWFAEALGMVLVAPVLLACSGAGPEYRPRGREWPEGVLALGAAAFINALMLTGWLREPGIGVLLTFMSFPILIWVAVRLSPVWTAAASLLVVGIAAAATARGHGPFEPADADTRTALFWGYASTLSVTVLLMNALVLESRAAGTVRGRLAAVLEATSDFVGTYDAAGRLLTLNAGGRRLIGLGRDADVRGRSMRDFLPAWAHSRIVKEGTPAAARQGEWSGETALLAPDGREVPVSQVILAHRGKGGRVEFFSTIMRDVSEPRRAHDALRDREARLRLVIDQIPAVLWTTDRALRFTSSVGGGLTALGLRPNDLVGQALTDYYHSPDPDFPPVAAARAALEGEASSYEIEWQGNVYRAHVEPLRDAQDAIIGAIGIALDITSRARVEEALRRSEDRYRVLVDGVHAIGWEADPTTRTFTFVSRGAEAITGYPADLWLAPGFWAAHLHPDDRERTAQQSAEKSQRGVPFELEYRFLAADGRTLWLRDYVSTELLYGRPERLYGVIIDATGRKRLEERLLAAQKMESVGRLAGGIAHDFNNILTAVLGCLDLIELGLAREHPAREHVAVARRASEHAADLTRQLLTFARRQVIEPRVVDLNALVCDTRAILHRLLGEDVELVIEPAPHPCAARIDPGQFEQILVNLAVNARDAMPTGGRLTISTRAERDADAAADAPHGHVVLTVQDSGMGMDESVRRHIFEPFFTTKGPGRGTGLGLATVHGIVEQHGGRIRLESSPGRGTTFEIALPRVHADAAPSSEPVPHAREPSATGTILLLEDDSLVRSVAALALRAEGYTVMEAGDPEEAVRIAHGHSGAIDLLLTDVVLPKFGGTRAAEIITQARPTLRVLYTSGHTDDAIVHHGVIAETVDFLPKPYTPAMLAARVRQAMTRTIASGPSIP